jgi:hypothetical protein
MNGKHAERLVLANTIHLLPRRTTARHDVATVPVWEKHTQMRSTVCGSELYTSMSTKHKQDIYNRHE